MSNYVFFFLLQPLEKNLVLLTLVLDDIILMCKLIKK